MKITKILLTFISFLLISQFSFAAADACPGTNETLNYSVSNVPAGQACGDLVVPLNFSPISAPTLTNGAASDSWTIPVPNNANLGTNQFSLSCGLSAVVSIDSLNVLDKDSQTCCGTGASAGKVWNGSSCAVETWTDYCPATVANGGSALHVNQTWQYNNSSPVNYRSKSPAAACCSVTGGLSECVAPVAGVCSAVVDTCTAGVFENVADTKTSRNWSCVGVSNGTTASCTLPNTPPTGTFSVSKRGITLGETVTITSTANDSQSNMNYHVFDWLPPTCPVGTPDCWTWNTGGYGGTGDWLSLRGEFSPKVGSNTFTSKTFTPNQVGDYSIHLAASDKTDNGIDNWVMLGGRIDTLTVCAVGRNKWGPE
jgi:hypothetical protein